MVAEWVIRLKIKVPKEIERISATKIRKGIHAEEDIDWQKDVASKQ